MGDLSITTTTVNMRPSFQFAFRIYITYKIARVIGRVNLMIGETRPEAKM